MDRPGTTRESDTVRFTTKEVGLTKTIVLSSELAVGGAFVGWIGTAASQLSFPEPVLAQSTLTPDAALAELMAENQMVTRVGPRKLRCSFR